MTTHLSTAAREALARHAARTDLAPTLWMDTALILERRLAAALEVEARTPATGLAIFPEAEAPALKAWNSQPMVDGWTVSYWVFTTVRGLERCSTATVARHGAHLRAAKAHAVEHSAGWTC